jgi:hypothetical protein
MPIDISVQVAIISAAASIFVASISVILATRQKQAEDLRQRKLEHYKLLLSAISDLVLYESNENAWNEANNKFASAANTIAMVAPQSVITALMAFHDEVKFSNPNHSPERHDQLLIELLLKIRRSLDLPFKDDPTTFTFHLIGSRPPKHEIT